MPLAHRNIERLASADCVRFDEVCREGRRCGMRAALSPRRTCRCSRRRARAGRGGRARCHDSLARKMPSLRRGRRRLSDHAPQPEGASDGVPACLDLAERGFVRACRSARAASSARMVQVSGVVLIRQRPGSCKRRVLSSRIEDETGVVPISSVWPDHDGETTASVVMGARLLEVRGRVEYDDEVIHVIAASDAPMRPTMLAPAVGRSSGQRRSRARITSIQPSAWTNSTPAIRSSGTDADDPDGPGQ